MSSENSQVRSPEENIANHFNDCRSRLQKTHFWSDYYHGQLSSKALHLLNSLCDRAIDTSEKTLDSKSIQIHRLLPNRLQSIINRIDRCRVHLPWFHSSSILFFYLPWIFLIECVIIIYQLSINSCNGLWKTHLIKFHFTLEILLILLLVFDGLQLVYYQQRKYFIWVNLLAFGMISRLCSCVVYLIILNTESSVKLCRAFYILKCLSLIQCFLFAGYLLEVIRWSLDYILNRYIRDRYGIALAYISSEEHILKIIHRLTDHGRE